VDVIVPVIVNVIAPVIVAVHAHGNAPVGVLSDAATVAITPTGPFTFTCTATITGPITITEPITTAPRMTMLRARSRDAAAPGRMTMQRRPA
jgi:hypothetical protein